MTKYTIGIYFNSKLTKVVLILKNRPKWQEGRYNFPGGHIEDGESHHECVAREFKEECGIETNPNEWAYIGSIENTSANYSVDVLTCKHVWENHGNIKTMEDQSVHWISINKLPGNIITNVPWLTLFALNFWRTEGREALRFGKFTYINK